jgi:hypothetical protein
LKSAKIEFSEIKRNRQAVYLFSFENWLAFF